MAETIVSRLYYSFQVVKKINVDSVYWCLVIRMKFHNENVLIGCLYRSPSSKFDEFFDHFENWAENIFSQQNKCILIGDFNLNFLNENDSLVKKFKNFIANIGVEQLIHEPTRVTNNSSTLIDYVLSSSTLNQCSVHEIPKITDHNIITVTIKSCQLQKSSTLKLYSDFSETKLLFLNEKLLNCNWNLNLNDTDTIYANLVKNISEQVNIISPLKSSKQFKSQLPWYDHEVFVAARYKDEAYKKFKNCRTVIDEQLNWAIYKSYRNEAVNLLKMKKADYYERKIDDCSHDPKKMWKSLKTLIKPNNSPLPDVIVFDTQRVMLDQNKAESFNNVFIESILDIKATIPASIQWSCENLEVLGCNLSDFKRLSLKELKSIISCLDNKCTTNIMNNKVLKSIFSVLGHVRLDFVNTSLINGHFPDQLEISTVVPVPKVYNANEAFNFRPLNTLL
ncbi:uncharacterized protein [Leptinotarsa decemlineata]|uniref:uncharacterized protein n=1 Tax=Leptinotarsa decemlineata TaxID=7539 RepID=UPI003D30AD6F